VGAATAEKDGAWVELRSPNFRVVCNDGERTARQMAKEFEQIRSVFSTLGSKLDIERSLLIVAARDEGTMKSLLPGYWEQKGGIRWGSVGESDGVRKFIVLRADVSPADPDRYTSAYWQYAASLIDASHPGLPLWAERGLADFYARTTVQGDKVLVGRAASESIQLLRERPHVPLETLLGADRHSPYYAKADQLHIFDATAWAFVHYLMLGDKGAHKERLIQFVAEADKGKDSAEGARAKLGDLRQLDAALDSYIRNFTFVMMNVPVTIDVSPKTFVARKLSAAEALGVRGALHVATERYPDAKAVLAEAERLNPDLASVHESLALVAFQQKDFGEARRHMQEALRVDADSLVGLRVQEWLDGSVRGGRVFLGADRSAPAIAGAADRACAAGELQACETLGDLLIRGVEGDKASADPKRGVAVLSKVCDAGVADACKRLAYAFDSGETLPADAAQAGVFEEKACTAGDVTSCFMAAVRHETGRGVDADAAHAVRLYDTACAKGTGDACSRAAFLLQSGASVPKDEARAVELHTKACEANAAASCVALGSFYFLGTGVPKDMGRAATLYQRGCDGGRADGCFNLATMYRTGTGVAKDSAHAAALFKLACDKGARVGCESLR
jgi:TPR repeat protein